MTIEEGLYVFLTNNEAISALLASRVYLLRLPQNPIYPAVVYKVISEKQPMTHGGTPGDLVTIRVQFDCHGGRYALSKQLKNVLKAELDGFNGLMGLVQVGHVRFLNAFDVLATVTKTAVISVDFRILYTQ